MRRRGQATVLAIAVLTPAGILALVGLALLGARVQGEHAQRLADAAALRSAMDLPMTGQAEAVITRRRVAGTWAVVVRLRPTRLRLLGLPQVAFTPEASAVARRITTDDGDAGAILVG